MLERKGFEEENIKMLVDDDDSLDVPNHINVKKALNWLTQERDDDDIIFMHFSGHGTQIPSDGDDEEEDQLDEAIVLDELFLMVDDDLQQYFSQVPNGAKVTVITDCCHSGTMLDGTEVVIEGPKDSSSAIAQEESDELVEALGGARGFEISENRSLSIDTIAGAMSSKLGGAEVAPNSSGVSGAMAQVFGGSAGKLMFKYASSYLSKNDDSGQMAAMLPMVMGALGGSGQSKTSGNPMSSMLGALGGATKQSSDPKKAIGGMVSSFFGGKKEPEPAAPPPQSDDPMSSVMGMMSKFGFGGQEGSTSSDAPSYNPAPRNINAETTVLITGCQSSETSADVRPTSGGAYGALTKTLTDIESKQQNISFYDLVSHVRSSLSAGGFSQNPCLETSPDRASEPFICES